MKRGRFSKSRQNAKLLAWPVDRDGALDEDGLARIHRGGAAGHVLAMPRERAPRPPTRCSRRAPDRRNMPRRAAGDEFPRARRDETDLVTPASTESDEHSAECNGTDALAFRDVVSGVLREHERRPIDVVVRDRVRNRARACGWRVPWLPLLRMRACEGSRSACVDLRCGIRESLRDERDVVGTRAVAVGRVDRQVAQLPSRVAPLVRRDAARRRAPYRARRRSPHRAPGRPGRRCPGSPVTAADRRRPSRR